MSAEKNEIVETVEGFISFEEAKKDLARISKLIADTEYSKENKFTSVVSLDIRLKSVRSLTTLLEKYADKIAKDGL